MRDDPTLGRIVALDSLRGWAIALVIAAHTSHWVTPATATVRTAASYGFLGVELFFVVSAFSLVYAHEQRSLRGEESPWAFYIRRAFRIMPMLWVAMCLYLWRTGLGPRDWAPDGISLLDVLIVGLGANGWHPLQINAVVPIGWSVGVEFSFYLIFPVLVIWVNSLWRAVLAVSIGFALSPIWTGYVGPLYLGTLSAGHLRDLTTTFLNYMSLPAQIPFFLAGFLAYFLLPKIHWRRSVAIILLFASIILFIGMVYGYRTGGPAMLHYVLIVTAFAMAVLAHPTLLLDNPVMRWIGKVSYSAYLLHMFVIYQLQGSSWAMAAYPISGDFAWLLAFVGVLAITVLLSSITYAAIELPLVRVGSRIASVVASHRSVPRILDRVRD